MSYIDALLKTDKDMIYVVERVNGKRVYTEYPTNYVMYYDDPAGKHRTTFGTAVTKISTKSLTEFQSELRIHSNKQTWECDVKPIFRCLADNYSGKDAPKLHTAHFDIETDFQAYAYKNHHIVAVRKISPANNQVIKKITVKELGGLENLDELEVAVGKTWVAARTSKYLASGPGFAPVDNPFNQITAISVYLDWVDKLITVAIPPIEVNLAEANKIADEFDDTFMFVSEIDMLNVFMELIDDADILTGWNSESYDIPYVVNRITMIMKKNDTRRLCLWNELPRKRRFSRYGADHETYDLSGRIHMDYMQLYRKYTYHEMHSYSLDAISEYELGEQKVAYSGTLDQLYNKDFRKFIEYSRQDTALLGKLDKKLQFLELANTIAHDTSVLLPTTMGAVALTEQAIINEAHSRGMVVQNRPKRRDVEDASPDKAAGAYVATPKRGMHKDVGAIDIKSLYPSVIRALNMCNETIIGQVRPDRTDKYIAAKMKLKTSPRTTFAMAWDGLFGSLEYTGIMQQSSARYIIEWEGEVDPTEHTGAEIWNMIFNSNMPWMLSANGTIFTNEKVGIIPGLLSCWYAERQIMQDNVVECNELSSGIALTSGMAKALSELLEEQ